MPISCFQIWIYFACLLCLTVGPIAANVGAQEEPPVVLEGRIEIPSKFSDDATLRLLELAVEALGIEVQGHVELSSVTPPAGRLIVDQMVGDPRRIVSFISGWLAIPEGLSWRSDVDRIRLEDLVLSFGSKRVSLTIARLSWRDGQIGPLAFTAEQEGEWSLNVQRAVAKRLPIHLSAMPELTDLQASALQLQWRPADVKARVDRFELLGSAIEDIAMELHEPSQEASSAVWQAAMASARIDLEGLWPWISQWPRVATWQQWLQEAQGLESVRLQGELRLSSLELGGQQTVGDEGAWVIHNAEAQLQANDVAAIGRQHDDSQKNKWLKISEATARLGLQPERLEIGHISLSAADSGGGTLSLKGHLIWPPDLQRMRLEIAARKMSWAGYSVDGELGWKAGMQTPIDLTASAPHGLSMEVQGRTQLWPQRDESGVDVILRDVKVSLPVRPQGVESESARPQKTTSDQPFLPRGPMRLPFPLRVQTDRVEIARWPVLSKFSVQSLSLGKSGERGQEPVSLGFRGQWCEIDLSGEVAADRHGELGMQLEGRIRDVAFSNLVACSLTVTGQEAPPVYIEGRTTGRLLAGTHGHTPAQLEDSTTADMALTLRQGRIMRLSNIDTSLGIILDILSLARLNPTQLRDTLPLDSLTLRLRQQGKTVEVRPIAFRSPLLRVDGSLKTDLGVAQPVMDLDMHIEAKGISKHLRKRINLEGEADAQDKAS